MRHYLHEKNRFPNKKHDIFHKKTHFSILIEAMGRGELQKNICFRVAFSFTMQAECLQLLQIQTPIQMFFCEFSKIFKKTYFINARERLLLKRYHLLESLFVKLHICNISKIGNCFNTNELYYTFP